MGKGVAGVLHTDRCPSALGQIMQTSGGLGLVHTRRGHMPGQVYLFSASISQILIFHFLTFS